MVGRAYNMKVAANLHQWDEYLLCGHVTHLAPTAHFYQRLEPVQYDGQEAEPILPQ